MSYSTPNKKRFTPATRSPIASKAKSPKNTRSRNIMRSLLKPFSNGTKEEIVSNNDVSKKALFSPPYVDTTQHSNDSNGLQSPPASPLKKREQLDRECSEAVRSIKQSVWNSAHEDLDGFLFMKYAPQLPSNYYDNKKPVLPPQRKQHNDRYTLVLDLDETLVHCSIDKVEECDLIFPVVFGGDTYKVYMKKRPHFKEFLEAVSEIFEVVIFTASQQCYADKLLNLVDPEKKLIHHRLFRNHCTYVEGNYVKDLRVLGRDLCKTVIIDNSPAAFTYQVNNGIPIISWYDDKFDDELLKTFKVLMKLATLSDVKPAVKKYFQIKKLLKSIKM